MVALLKPPEHMGARIPLVPCPRTVVFSTIFAGEANMD